MLGGTSGWSWATGRKSQPVIPGWPPGCSGSRDDLEPEAPRPQGGGWSLKAEPQAGGPGERGLPVFTPPRAGGRRGLEGNGYLLSPLLGDDIAEGGTGGIVARDHDPSPQSGIECRDPLSRVIEVG